MKSERNDWCAWFAVALFCLTLGTARAATATEEGHPLTDAVGVNFTNAEDESDHCEVADFTFPFTFKLPFR